MTLAANPYATCHTEEKWRAVASEFQFAPGLTYLNCGSEGSLPRRMQELLAESMRRWASSPSQAFFDDPNLNSQQTANRERLARFAGAAPADLVLTDNTTMGLGMALLGLPFAPGDEILTTRQDHFSMYSPLTVLARRGGIKVVELPLPVPARHAQDIVEIFRRAITRNTRAFCFSHINYGVGLRMPVREICELARAHGIATIVDGAHALGMLDLNIDELGVDFYAASGHKWLNGPPGTGLFYVRNSQDNPWKLEPIISERAMEISADLTITDALQARANLNGPAFYTMARVAEFAEEIGKQAIQQRILQLAALVQDRAVALWGPDCLFSPTKEGRSDALCCGLTAFVPSRSRAMAFDTKRMQQIANTLVQEYGVCVLSTQVPVSTDPGAPQLNTIRVSTNIFNFPEQIDHLFDLLQRLA